MQRHSVKLKIESSILKYARVCSGYDIRTAAEKISMDEEKLLSLESQDGEITIAKLEKIAGIYKMPLTYFLLKEVPKDVLLPKDFRIVYSSETQNFSPVIMLAIRHARYIQSVIKELSETEIVYPFKAISIKDDVDKIANNFRTLLGVSFKEQSKWSDPAVALRNWKNAVEGLNIYVMQQNLSKDSKEDVSAFCLADQSPYIIVLDSSEHENRRSFSLFHEIAHVLLHRSGICTPDNFSRNSFEYIKIEKFCNQFAASLLVPLEELVTDPIVIKLKGLPFERWGDNDVSLISSKFRVSQEVIYRRLVTVGILDEKLYELKRIELVRNFIEYRTRKKKEGLIIPQHIKILSKNGRAYSSFVLDSLHANRITLSDAASYLDTKSQHILKVEAFI